MLTPVPDRQRTSFPRGLVLGLTMAETAILIIFVLLLALTALLGQEADRRRDAEQELAQFREIQSVLAQRGVEPEAVLETIRNYATDRMDADNWRELVRRVSTDVTNPSPEEIASRLDEAHAALDLQEALDDLLLDRANSESPPEDLQELVEIAGAGVAAGLTATEVRDAIATHHALQDSLREHGEEATPQAVQSLVADAQRWLESGGDPEGGSGTDHPSCWYDTDKTVAYLFDIALTDEGFVVQPARAPQHDEERASLPLAPIRTGRVLTPTQFREQTREVFERSVDDGCRFFVRAFDLTAADQKEVYKERMRTLESRFYKNANPSGPPPSVDPAPLGLLD